MLFADVATGLTKEGSVSLDWKHDPGIVWPLRVIKMGPNLEPCDGKLPGGTDIPDTSPFILRAGHIKSAHADPHYEVLSKWREFLKLP